MTDNNVADAPADMPKPGILCAVARIAAAVAVVAAGYIVVWTAADVLRLYHPLPFQDQWDFLPYLARYFDNDLELHEWWDQHNEHRILFPRLVFLADAVWFGGNSIFSIAVSCLLQVLHAAVVVHLVGRAVPLRGAPRVLMAAVVAACMLHGSQVFNLFWGFQVQFVMIYLAVTLSLCQLARQRTGLVQVGAAVLLGCIATGSMANGVLVWPLLWSLAVQRRLPRRWLAVLVVAGVGMLVAYFVGYKTPGNSTSPLQALADPLKLLGHYCGYLGNPIWTCHEVPSVTAGAVTLLVSLWVVLRRLPRWFGMAPIEAVLVHIVMLVLASGALTAAGRLNVNLSDILNSRYATPTLLLWAALLGLTSFGATSVRLWRIGALTALALGLAWLAPGHRIYIQPIPEVQSDNASSLLSGVRDAESLRRNHGSGQFLIPLADTLRARRLSVFGSGLQFLIGTNLRDHFTVQIQPVDTASIGQFEAVPGHEGATRITGWTYEPHSRRPPELMLVVDERWRIVGLGLVGFWRRDVSALVQPLPDERIGWSAFVREPDYPGRKLAVYAVWEGRAVPISTSSHGAPYEVSETALTDDFTRLGPIVGLSGLEIFGSWSNKAWPRETPAPPFLDAALSSSLDGDGGTGRVRISILSRADDAVLLVPLVTGPVATEMSVRIIDPRSRTEMASLQAPYPFPDRWRLWRVPLPARKDGGAWVVEAEDQGRGWGQWCGIGFPHWEIEPR